MTTKVAERPATEIQRPLHVLVPLIKKDLDEAKEAAARAGMPYYKAAGEKMLEAKAQLRHGEFMPWIKREFKLTQTTAGTYMQLAKATWQNPSALGFSSLREFTRDTGKQRGTGKTSWHEPVKARLESLNLERYRQDLQNKQKERDLERKLALELIDIGYKVLATKLHPDRGGSPEAMTRLNHVRSRLKDCA